MNKPQITEAAKEIRREYARQWRKKNPEKQRAIAARYWEKKAREAQQAQEGEPAAELQTVTE